MGLPAGALCSHRGLRMARGEEIWPRRAWDGADEGTRAGARLLTRCVMQVFIKAGDLLWDSWATWCAGSSILRWDVCKHP